MAANRDARGSIAEANKPVPEQRLLWNQENVKDVAESLGIGALADPGLRSLSQDVEFRIGQVIIESLRVMRHSRRTHMTVNDVAQALRVLDVEPLYGYSSSRELKYGEANLGSQAFFYVEDEETEFEKMINFALPKIPREVSFTKHWVSLDGVQPSSTSNPTSAEARVTDLLPRGPGANPALAALAGLGNPNFKPAIKHVVSKELILYFEKIQAALMDENDDPEVQRLQDASLASVSSEPSIHQLVPYFVNFVSNQVTHHLDDTFVLQQMMKLTQALISNEHVFLETYAGAISAAVLTCMLSRKIGTGNDVAALKSQFAVREFAASLLGHVARKYAEKNKVLRPKLVRTCLKYLLNPSVPAGVWYGAIQGLIEAGGNEVVRIILLKNLKEFDRKMLTPLRQKGDPVSNHEFKVVVSAILKGIQRLKNESSISMEGMNGFSSEREAAQLKAFVGDIVGDRIVQLGDHALNRTVLEARSFIEVQQGMRSG